MSFHSITFNFSGQHVTLEPIFEDEENARPWNIWSQLPTDAPPSSGTELPLVVERYGLLNDIFPFPSIQDAGYPIFNLHLANVLFDIILPSVLGSSLWSFGKRITFKYLNCSGIWHSLYVTKPA